MLIFRSTLLIQACYFDIKASIKLYRWLLCLGYSHVEEECFFFFFFFFFFLSVNIPTPPQVGLGGQPHRFYQHK